MPTHSSRPHLAPADRLRPPHDAQRQSSGKGQARPHAALAAAPPPGLGSVSYASSAMAICSSLRCEIRAVVLHLWPDEIKVHPHVRVTIPVGRRGQPVKKLRTMPMTRVHELCNKSQRGFVSTVTFGGGLGFRLTGVPRPVFPRMRDLACQHPNTISYLCRTLGTGTDAGRSSGR